MIECPIRNQQSTISNLYPYTLSMICCPNNPYGLTIKMMIKTINDTT